MEFASQQLVGGTTTSVSTGYKTHLTPQASSLVVPGFDGQAPSTSISQSQGLMTPGSALHVGSRGQSPQISRHHRRQAQDMNTLDELFSSHTLNNPATTTSVSSHPLQSPPVYGSQSVVVDSKSFQAHPQLQRYKDKLELEIQKCEQEFQALVEEELLNLDTVSSQAYCTNKDKQTELLNRLDSLRLKLSKLMLTSEQMNTIHTSSVQRKAPVTKTVSHVAPVKTNQTPPRLIKTTPTSITGIIPINDPSVSTHSIPYRTEIVTQDKTNFQKWTLKFDSSKCPLQQFLKHFESHAQLSNYNESQKTQQLLSSFGNDTSRIIDKLPLQYTYSDLIAILQSIYDPPGQREALQLKLRTIRRRPNQTPRQFADELHDAVARAYPTLSSSERDVHILQQFVHGHPDNIATLLNTQISCTPSWSIDDAVNSVVRFEATADARKSDGVLSKGSLLDNMTTHVSTPTPPTTPAVVVHKPPVSSTSEPSTSVNAAISNEDCFEDELSDMVDSTMFQIANLDPEDVELDDVLDILSMKMVRRFPRKFKDKSRCLFCNAQSHQWRNCFKLMHLLQIKGLRHDIASRRRTVTSRYQKSPGPSSQPKTYTNNYPRTPTGPKFNQNRRRLFKYKKPDGTFAHFLQENDEDTLHELEEVEQENHLNE